MRFPQPLQQPPQAAEERPRDFVITSEARNLSFFASAQPPERFLASLGMTKMTAFSATSPFPQSVESVPSLVFGLYKQHRANGGNSLAIDP